MWLSLMNLRQNKVIPENQCSIFKGNWILFVTVESLSKCNYFLLKREVLTNTYINIKKF